MIKLEKTLGGIRTMAKVPSAVWIVDTKKEHLAVDEARKLGLPVIAILDTNCDPDEVDYKIPGNDDAIRSVTLLTRVIADAVADGLIVQRSVRQVRRPTRSAEEPLAEWERELLTPTPPAADDRGPAECRRDRRCRGRCRGCWPRPRPRRRLPRSPPRSRPRRRRRGPRGR